MCMCMRAHVRKHTCTGTHMFTGTHVQARTHAHDVVYVLQCHVQYVFFLGIRYFGALCDVKIRPVRDGGATSRGVDNFSLVS